MFFRVFLILTFVVMFCLNFKLLIYQPNLDDENLNLYNESQYAIPYNKINVYEEENATDCSILTECDINDSKSCFFCDGTNFKCKSFKYDQLINDIEFEKYFVIPKNKSSSKGYCVKSRRCNKFTSDRILVKLSDGSVDYLCKCKYPNLVDKSNTFTDCNLVKACGLLGKLKNKFNDTVNIKREIDFDPFYAGICKCPNGLKSSFSKLTGPSCEPLHVKEFDKCHEGIYIAEEGVCNCEKGYVSSNNYKAIENVGYLKEIARIFTEPQCIKNPCQCDPVISNDYNPNNVFVDEVGCLCDYKNGWIGVRNEEHSKDFETSNWIDAKHYNSCVHISERNDRHITYTFFYTKYGLYTKHEYKKSKLRDWLLKIIETDAGFKTSDKIWIVEKVYFDGETYSPHCYYMNAIKRNPLIVLSTFEGYYEIFTKKYRNGPLKPFYPRQCFKNWMEHEILCTVKDKKYDKLFVLNPEGVKPSPYTPNYGSVKFLESDIALYIENTFKILPFKEDMIFYLVDVAEVKVEYKP